MDEKNEKRAFWAGVVFAMYRDTQSVEVINEVIDKFLPDAKGMDSDTFDAFLMDVGLITEDEIILYHLTLGFGVEDEDDYVPLEDEETEYVDWEWECPDCEEDNIDYLPKGEKPIVVTCEGCGKVFKFEEVEDEDKK